MSTEIRAEKEPWSGQIELLVLRREGQQIVAVGDDITMQQPKPGQRPRSTMSLDGHMAQMLMDDLWRCGIRPSEGSGSAGQLAATQLHLAHITKIHDRMFDWFIRRTENADNQEIHRQWMELERTQAKQGRG